MLTWKLARDFCCGHHTKTWTGFVFWKFIDKCQENYHYRNIALSKTAKIKKLKNRIKRHNEGPMKINSSNETHCKRQITSSNIFKQY